MMIISNYNSTKLTHFGQFVTKKSYKWKIIIMMPPCKSHFYQFNFICFLKLWNLILYLKLV